MADRIAVIGLGHMGGPMAARLLAAGAEVVGSDPADVALRAFVAAGGTSAASAAEAVAGADAVILMLPDSGVVEAVLADEALLAALAPDVLVIDMSSSEPLRTRALAERLRARGVRLVDAPVSGGVRGAETGHLTIMLGAPDDDVARLAALLAPLGTVVHAGPVGAGHAAKAFNNLLSATHLWVTSEAIIAAERYGLEPATLLAVVNGSSGRSGSSELKWPDFILTDRYDSGFSAGLMLKDMRIAVRLAAALGSPSVLGQAAVDRWEAAVADLGPSADHTEIARWIADQEGGG